MALTAVDLFAGAGGFTEGFRQMGFQVLASVDNWGPAIETHRKNHADTEAIHGDILALEPDVLPKVDVLIGSPPCTQFSYANRGGGGDIAAGMKLVLRFLRFVHELKPRYWIMENVPRLIDTLPESVPLRRLGVDKPGNLDIPVRKILNAADFGVPQKRLRLFSGKYPVPTPTHTEPGSIGRYSGLSPWIPMKHVLDALPNPLVEPRDGTELSDPNYGFQLPVNQLTDHFIDTVLTEEEVRQNRKAKTDHSWYGKMTFPDTVDKPARTVMATQLSISRETMVLESRSNGKRVYRRPTIRECASFSAFPITYQFWGASAATRYKLVGNAVPPPLAGAVARLILLEEGLPVPTAPRVRKRVDEPVPPLNHSARPLVRRRIRYPLQRKFRDHIPGSRAEGARVDLDNLGSTPSAHPFARTLDEGHWARVPHLRHWVARLFVGSGDDVLSIAPALEEAVAQLSAWAQEKTDWSRLRRFMNELASKLPFWLPDATTLQGVWAGRVETVDVTPTLILERLQEIVSKHFPTERFEGQRVPVVGKFPNVRRDLLPVRACAFLVAASYATEIINRSDQWIARHWSEQYRPDTWSIVGASVRTGPRYDARRRLLDLFQGPFLAVSSTRKTD
jgi:DNA (cytosine-5)-methyltransferase 1